MKLQLLIAAFSLGGCSEVPTRSEYSPVIPVAVAPEPVPLKAPVKVSASTTGYTYGISGAGHYPSVTSNVSGITYASYAE